MQQRKLSGHHLATAERLLAHPASHNIAWHDVVALIGHVGSIHEEDNHRFTVTMGSETETFDKPRGEDIDVQQVVDLRRMLHQAGITPASLKR